MRERLAEMYVEQAKADKNFIVLSGDHGYALFDPIRQHCPDQFVNVGVAEQGLVGYASGLAQAGFKPVIYGLASFVPMRVLEQIRLDLCLANHDVVIFGDGAGLVYSTLGSSHQCTEDLAVTRVLPNMKVYSPCDQFELEDCFLQALQEKGPSYIRLGKADRPSVHSERAGHCKPRVTCEGDTETVLISTGSFCEPSQVMAKELGLTAISVPQIHPIDPSLLDLTAKAKTVICLEEHNKTGGLYSTCLELWAENDQLTNKKIHSISLDNKFNQHCGSYQYALTEHQLDDASLLSRVKKILSGE